MSCHKRTVISESESDSRQENYMWGGLRMCLERWVHARVVMM